MSKGKLNNRALLGVLVALAIIYFATNFMQNQRRNAATDLPALFSFDAGEVTQITVKPISGDEITVVKNSTDDWTVQEGEKSAKASTETVNQYLKDLLNIKADRLVSKNADRWADFGLADSAALQVSVQTSDDNSAEKLLLGRFKYQQSGRGFGGQTYVRRAGADETYIAGGFLSGNLNKSISQWRNQAILSFNRADIEDIIWYYPADSGFVLNNASGKWKINSSAADSAKTISFVNGLQKKQFGTFEYKQPIPSEEAPFKMVLNLSNGSSTTIRAWENPEEEGGYLIHSSLNNEALFKSSASELFDDLFVAKSTFLKD